VITRASDGILSGVCAGIARRLDLEPWLVRFLFVCSIILLGTGIFFYLLLTFSLPREDRKSEAYNEKIMGVCATIAKRADLDIGLTRFLALVLLFTSFGCVLIGYVVLYFALPTAAEEKPLQASSSPTPSQTEVSSK
jgi:phage shock protein C